MILKWISEIGCNSRYKSEFMKLRKELRHKFNQTLKIYT